MPNPVPPVTPPPSTQFVRSGSATRYANVEGERDPFTDSPPLARKSSIRQPPSPSARYNGTGRDLVDVPSSPSAFSTSNDLLASLQDIEDKLTQIKRMEGNHDLSPSPSFSHYPSSPKPAPISLYPSSLSFTESTTSLFDTSRGGRLSKSGDSATSNKRFSRLGDDDLYLRLDAETHERIAKSGQTTHMLLDEVEQMEKIMKRWSSLDNDDFVMEGRRRRSSPKREKLREEWNKDWKSVNYSKRDEKASSKKKRDKKDKSSKTKSKQDESKRDKVTTSNKGGSKKREQEKTKHHHDKGSNKEREKRDNEKKPLIGTSHEDLFRQAREEEQKYKKLKEQEEKRAQMTESEHEKDEDIKKESNSQWRKDSTDKSEEEEDTMQYSDSEDEDEQSEQESYSSSEGESDGYPPPPSSPPPPPPPRFKLKTKQGNSLILI